MEPNFHFADEMISVVEAPAVPTVWSPTLDHSPEIKNLDPDLLDAGLSRLRNALQGRARAGWSLDGPDLEFMRKQDRIWDFLLDHYFRVETDGWENVPAGPCLFVGIHSGTWLTMDAWTLCAEWWRRFGTSRILHGTAHDALMAMPVIGSYFRKVGVIPASRTAVTQALEEGHDVVVWPGGEVDSMRNWTKRDKVVLGGRQGFIRQAMASGVPIVPVATVGGHDTVFVLSEARGLAKALRLKKLIRSDIAPLTLGFPFGLTFEALPMHLPLPAKIRTRFLPPLELDPDRGDDILYRQAAYQEVEDRIQAGVNELAKKRRFPIFG
ncbi:MAG: lysophospholipid acyltransferase family protein [Pseudomonadota bacterium]